MAGPIHSQKKGKIKIKIGSRQTLQEQQQQQQQQKVYKKRGGEKTKTKKKKKKKGGKKKGSTADPDGPVFARECFCLFLVVLAFWTNGRTNRRREGGKADDFTKVPKIPTEVDQ